MRRQLWEYDQVLNTQRDRVYGERRRALESDDLSVQMVEYAERTVDDILEARSLPSQDRATERAPCWARHESSGCSAPSLHRLIRAMYRLLCIVLCYFLLVWTCRQWLGCLTV